MGQQTDDDGLDNDWRDEITIENTYEKHRPEFLKFLEGVADM